MIQQSHVKMFSTSRDVLDLFGTLWQPIPAFVTARAGLGTAIVNIQNEALNQAGKTTGGTGDKHVARKIACDAAAIVGGAVAAYADTQNNQELFDSVDFSSPDLMRMSEQNCATNCKVILDAGTANLAPLVLVKSLAQTDLDDLTTKLGNYNTALTRPRQLRTKISAATSQMPELINVADRILERQIDRLMERFKASNPDFYAAYKVARIIVDAGGGAGAPPTPPTTPPAK